MGGASGLYGQQDKCIQWFSGDAWRKGPPGKSRYKLEENVNMDFKKQDVRVWNGFIWLKYDKWWAPINTIPYKQM